MVDWPPFDAIERVETVSSESLALRMAASAVAEADGGGAVTFSSALRFVLLDTDTDPLPSLEPFSPRSLPDVLCAASFASDNVDWFEEDVAVK